MWIFEGEWEQEPIRWNLAEGTYRVGRESASDLRIGDRSVSREHAEIKLSAGKAELRDLGSRNGTWVGGKRIEGSHVLRPGDRIRFGNVEVVFRASEPTEPESAAADTDSLLSEPNQVRTSYSLSWDVLRRRPPEVSSHERRLLAAVLEAGHLLVEHRPLEGVFRAVLDLVDRVIPARRVLLLVRDGEEEIPSVRAARPAAGAEERIMLSRTIIDTVMRARESVLVTDAQSDARFRRQESIVAQNIRSALVAPLFDNERVIGLIYADSSDPLVTYDQDQLRALSLLANLIAVKISQTRLLLEQQEKERLARELATAAAIQRSLLPSSFPAEGGYEILARQIPCDQVGGDLYDGTLMGDGRLALTLGDVSGKGMGAALLMSNIMASLRILNEEGPPLAQMASRLNRHVLRCTDPVNYVTLFLGRVDPRAHTLEYVNAGHNPPVIVFPGGATRSLDSNGPPIGLLSDAEFRTDLIELPERALVAVYSDGITEARRDRDFFEEDRLRESLRRRIDLPLSEIAAGVLADVDEFLGCAPAGDDVTLLLLRRSPAAPVLDR